MPGGPPSTQSGDRHDRVVSPPRNGRGHRRRVGRGHKPRDLVPRLARCSVFKDRFTLAAKGLSGHTQTASRATSEYIGPRQPCSTRSSDAKPRVATLADLQHLAVELAGRHVEPIARDHTPADPHSPLLDEASRLAAADPEV